MRNLSLLGVLSLSLVAACSSSQAEDPGSQEAAHTEGEYVHAPNNPFFWDKSAPHSELSFDDVDLSKVVADSDPLAVRLQAWSDRIDQIVRAQIRKQSGEELVAPKPIMKVLPSDRTFNAWVSGTFACLGVPFQGYDSEPATSHTFLSSQGHQGVLPEDLGGAACRRPSQWPGGEELARRWAELSPSCDLTFSNGALSSPTCSGPTSPDTMLVTVTPWVHFSTDLLMHVDEKTAVLILAHELGHYYRAHSSTMASHKYGFWYEQDPALPMRPLPAEKQEQIQTQYQGILTAPKDTSIAGSKYHGRMHRSLAYLGSRMKTHRGNDPAFVCAKAVEKVGPWTDGFLFPQEAGLGATATTAYLAFETELAACAPALKLATGAQGADAFPTEYVSSAFQSGGFAPEALLKDPGTLEAALTGATNAAKGMDTEEQAMLDRFREGKIGLYTTEQEADDIALDLSTKLGITSGEVLGGWLKFMKAIEGIGGKFPENESGELGYAKCKALLDADFQETLPDGSKRPLQVTLGALESAHHGSCYRLYNLWRENNAHKYEVTETFTPPSGPTWAELVAHAAELTGGGKTVPPEATTPPEDVPPAITPSSDGDEEPEDVGGGVTPATKKTVTTGGCVVAHGADPGSLPLAAIAFGAFGFVLVARRRRWSAR